MNRRVENGSTRMDDAARAGWLYYIAGNTQEEIASKLGISRQSAQRLVSLAVSEGLVKVRLDHPIARCLDLAGRLRSRFALDLVEVVPSDPASRSTTAGIAQAAAAEMERRLRSPRPLVMAVGTGRTLKATIEQLPPIECPQHRVVSLTGNIGPDGSASYYNVIFGMADSIKARLFPMPLPVIVSSAEERDLLHQQEMIRSTLRLAEEADVTFVGIGDLGPAAPLFEDGFITKAELKALQKAGAVGEIVGDFRRRGTADRRPYQRARGERADPLARALAGGRHRHGSAQAARHSRRRKSPPRQRPDHRRDHCGGLARQVLSAPAFFMQCFLWRAGQTCIDSLTAAE
jgi:DNA-binding transcriptional regulator LsrR (DeoR family)